MFRLLEHLRCQKILELGTSLGISTLYLAKTDANAAVYTLEGDNGSYSIATHLFEQLKQANINATFGKFSETLKPTLSTMNGVDAAFIDGHHDEQATVAYFEEIAKSCHADSVIIVDDIYWSDGMQKAWQHIIKSSRITLSIDLFFCGLVFFRKEQKEKEHFKIRPDRILYHL